MGQKITTPAAETGRPVPTPHPQAARTTPPYDSGLSSVQAASRTQPHQLHTTLPYNPGISPVQGASSPRPQQSYATQPYRSGISSVQSASPSYSAYTRAPTLSSSHVSQPVITKKPPEPPPKYAAAKYGASEMEREVTKGSDDTHVTPPTDGTSLQKDNLSTSYPDRRNQPKSQPDVSSATDEKLFKHVSPTTPSISKEFNLKEDVPSLTKHEQYHKDSKNLEVPHRHAVISSSHYKISTENIDHTSGMQSVTTIVGLCPVLKKETDISLSPTVALMSTIPWKKASNASCQHAPVSARNSEGDVKLDEIMLADLCPIYSIEGKKIVTLASAGKSEQKEQNDLRDRLITFTILRRIFVTFPSGVKVSDLETFGEALDPNMKRVLESTCTGRGGCWSDKLCSLMARFPMVFQLDNGSVRRWEGGLNWLDVSWSSILHIVVANLLEKEKTDLNGICTYLHDTCNVTHLPDEGELTPISLRNYFERCNYQKSEVILKDTRFASLSKTVLKTEAKKPQETSIGTLPKAALKAEVAVKAKEALLAEVALKGSKDLKAEMVLKPEIKKPQDAICDTCNGIESFNVLCVGEVLQVTFKGTMVWWYFKHKNLRRVNTFVYATEKGVVMDSKAPITDCLKKGDMVTFSPNLFNVEGQMTWLARHVHTCPKAAAMKPNDDSPAKATAQNIITNFKRNKPTIFWDCCGIVVKTGKKSGAIWFPGNEEIPFSLFAEIKQGESWIVGGSTISEIDEALTCGERVVFDIMTSKSWTGCMIWIAKCIRKFDSSPRITGDISRLIIGIVLHKNVGTDSKLNLIKEDIVPELEDMIERCEKPYWDQDQEPCEGSVAWNESGEVSRTFPKFFQIVTSDGEKIPAEISLNCWNPDSINFNETGKEYLFCAECQIDDGKPKWLVRLVMKPLQSVDPSPEPLTAGILKPIAEISPPACSTVGIPKPTAEVRPSKTDVEDCNANIESLVTNQSRTAASKSFFNTDAIAAQFIDEHIELAHRLNIADSQSTENGSGKIVRKSWNEDNPSCDLLNAGSKFNSVACQTYSTGRICSFDIYCD